MFEDKKTDVKAKPLYMYDTEAEDDDAWRDAACRR
jgi:hypothetical protein